MSGFNQKDAALKVTKTLPASNTTGYSSGLDLGHGLKGDFLANAEVLISLAAVATGELADAATHKVSLQHDDDSAFGTVADLYADILTQTGAGGAGAAATTVQVRLPVDVKRYIRLKIVKSDNHDASAKSATMELVL